MGRVVAIFAAIFGSLVYSLFILSMNLFNKIDENDTISLKKIVEQECEKKYKRSAGILIANFILFNYNRQKKD